MKSYRLVPEEAMIYCFIGILGLFFLLAPNGAKAAPQPTMKELKSWRSTIMRTPRPKKGCFTADYPKTKWREVPCVKAPVTPYLPSRGQQPFTVGNGNDVSSQVSSGHISEAIGSFDSVSGVANEYGVSPNTGLLTANVFSLQLNSNFFSGTAACNGVSGCQGWAQFVYSNTAGMAFIQYWLINYGPSCPGSGGPAGTGWMAFSNSCYGNSNAVVITGSPPLNISTLNQLSVTGQAASGSHDTLTMYVGGTAYTTNDQDSVVDLANYWQTAEFNIFGDGNGSAATFNYQSPAVASVKVRTAVDNGSSTAPSCQAAGYTAETNNLYFGAYSAIAGSGPNLAAVVFTESSTNSGYAACQNATSTGDTHLTTFAGLEYDFQATGDFVLTEAGTDFVVQTRQAAPVIDPRWKNTSINKAVAVKIGQTRVALYVGPTKLTIDGKPYSLSDGQKPIEINGVRVVRNENEYVIISPKGDNVRALLFDNGMNKWMNVSVSLSHATRQVQGLLGNLEGNMNEFVTSHGTVLKSPLSFNDLYSIYGESWRVKPDQMLLEVDPTLKSGIPEKPFYVNDLKPKEVKRATAICKAAGVSEPALLDACALDTAVLGNNDIAAQAYAHAVAPRAVMARP